MGCCGDRRNRETNGQAPEPRYRHCPRCKGPVQRRVRYDEKLRRYVEVEVCPVCAMSEGPFYLY